MEIDSGFYSLNHFSKEDLKEFFFYCLTLSYKSSVQHLVGFKREIHPFYSEKDVIENHLGDRINSVCIDRSVQNTDSKYGEIGFNTFCAENLFLYIFVSLENFKKIIKKYNLEIKK